jgi:hypothetical protein
VQWCFCEILYSVLNCAKQIVGIERLVQESDDTIGECGLFDVFVTMSGNKDDRQFRIAKFDAALQLKTVHARHAHVGDDADCFGEDGGLQSLFGGGERCCAEVGRLQQAFDRFPNLSVVIHDDYDLFHRANQGDPPRLYFSGEMQGCLLCLRIGPVRIS